MFDYSSFSFKEELIMATQKVRSEGLDKFSSLRGRGVCIMKFASHAAGVISKPMCYLASIISVMALKVIINIDGIKEKLKEDPSEESTALRDIIEAGKNDSEFVDRFISTYTSSAILAAPFGQLLLMCKAALGIIHPGIYFRNDQIAPHLKELATIASEVGCSQELIKSLKNPEKFYENLNSTNTIYYETLFTNYFEQICTKFKEADFPAKRKKELLNELAPVPALSGIDSCPPGLGRTLEMIVNCMNIPAEPKEVMPWLAEQFKMEVVNKMIMQTDNAIMSRGNGVELSPWQNALKKLAHDPAHRGNALIIALGEKIGLKQSSIDQAKQDVMANKVKPSDQDIEEIYQEFVRQYTNDNIKQYMINQINSKPDGSQGLKAFRNEVIRQFIETVTEEELEASKADVENYFKNDLFADDPSFYVQYHYFKHHDPANPMVDYSQENATDLNERAIIKYCETIGLAL